MRRHIAQASLADVAGLDRKMRRHREIAKQAFTLRDARMLGGDHVAKAPHRDVAKTFGRRKQLPIFQLVAERGVGDVVGGESEAIDLHQQRVGGQRVRIGQQRLDQLALLKIISGDDEIGCLHVSIQALFGPRSLPSAAVLQQQQCLKQRSSFLRPRSRLRAS
jgi:hypothetical protein